MKKPMKFCGWILLTASLFCISMTSVAGQGFELTAGAGITELFFVGTRFPASQTQIALSVGGLPGKGETNMFAASGDIIYHFVDGRVYPDKLPIYAKVGLSYLRNKEDRSTKKYILLNTRAGLEYPLSNHIAIGVEGGVAFILDEDEKLNPSYVSNGDFRLNFDFPFWPTAGVSFIYRIQ